MVIGTNIDLLWKSFDADFEIKREVDYGILGVIADVYREVGNDRHADCLAWLIDKKVIVRRLHVNGFGWYLAPCYRYGTGDSPCRLQEDLFILKHEGLSLTQNKPTIIEAYLWIIQFWRGTGKTYYAPEPERKY